MPPPLSDTVTHAVPLYNRHVGRMTHRAAAALVEHFIQVFISHIGASLAVAHEVPVKVSNSQSPRVEL